MKEMDENLEKLKQDLRATLGGRLYLSGNLKIKSAVNSVSRFFKNGIVVPKIKHPKGAGKNKYTVLHHVFRPSLPFLQSQNPQRSPATPAVLLNQEQQIQPKSARKTWYISLFRLPNRPTHHSTGALTAALAATSTQ
jgi:hypothetical protein